MLIITPILVTHPIHLCFQLIFASIQPKPPASHIISSFATGTSITSACQEAWPDPRLPYHFGEKLWNVVESETMEILSVDKVPLRDNKGATSGNCI